MTDTSYRPAEESDADSISALVRHALLPTTLPGWTSKAITSLIAKASPEALGGLLGEAAFARVALESDSIVGFILARTWRFLNLLVVDPSFQRRGIGTQLLQLMLNHVAESAPDLSVVEVNATEYSLPFYRRLGYYPLSQLVEYDGCRFVRLGFWRKNPLLAKREC